MCLASLIAGGVPIRHARRGAAEVSLRSPPGLRPCPCPLLYVCECAGFCCGACVPCLCRSVPRFGIFLLALSFDVYWLNLPALCRQSSCHGGCFSLLHLAWCFLCTLFACPYSPLTYLRCTVASWIRAFICCLNGLKASRLRPLRSDCCRLRRWAAGLLCIPRLFP